MSLMKSLSCKGSSSVSIVEKSSSNRSRSSSGKKAPIDLREMTEEEENRPLGEYYEKKGRGKRFRRFVARMTRKKAKTANGKGKNPAALRDSSEAGYSSKAGNTSSAAPDGDDDEIVEDVPDAPAEEPQPQPKKWTRAMIRKTFLLSW